MWPSSDSVSPKSQSSASINCTLIFKPWKSQMLYAVPLSLSPNNIHSFHIRHLRTFYACCVTIALVLLPLRFHQFFFLLYFTVCSHKEYLCASFILFVHYLIWGGKDTRLNSIEIIHEWNIEWNENHYEFICPSSGMKCDRWIDVFLNTIIWWWCHRQSPLGKKTKLMKKKTNKPKRE